MNVTLSDEMIANSFFKTRVDTQRTFSVNKCFSV